MPKFCNKTNDNLQAWGWWCRSVQRSWLNLRYHKQVNFMQSSKILLSSLIPLCILGKGYKDFCKKEMELVWVFLRLRYGITILNVSYFLGLVKLNECNSPVSIPVQLYLVHSCVFDVCDRIVTTVSKHLEEQVTR